MENETEQIDTDRKEIPFEKYMENFSDSENSQNEKDFLISFALELGYLDSENFNKKSYLSEREQKEKTDSQDYDTTQQDNDDLNELSEEKQKGFFEFCFIDGKIYENGNIDNRIKDLIEYGKRKEDKAILRAIKPTNNTDE